MKLKANMKGPGIRYDIDIRRVWECPACGNRRKFPGNVTARRCSCEAHEWMRLIDEKNQRQFPVRARIEIPEEEPAENERESPAETSEESVSGETPHSEPISETTDVVQETNVETSPPTRDKKKRKQKKKKSANQNDQPQAELPEQSSAESNQTEKPTSDAQSASSDDDDEFGENIFED